VDGLIDWIRTLPSLDARPRSEITIHGLTAKMLDVGVAPSWTTSCPGATQPIAAFLTEAVSGPNADTYAITAGGHSRLLFLDLGGGDILMIDVASSDTARFDSLVAEAMPIIQSFIFE